MKLFLKTIGEFWTPNHLKNEHLSTDGERSLLFPPGETSTGSDVRDRQTFQRYKINVALFDIFWTAIKLHKQILKSLLCRRCVHIFLWRQKNSLTSIPRMHFAHLPSCRVVGVEERQAGVSSLLAYCLCTKVVICQLAASSSCQKWAVHTKRAKTSTTLRRFLCPPLDYLVFLTSQWICLHHDIAHAGAQVWKTS